LFHHKTCLGGLIDQHGFEALKFIWSVDTSVVFSFPSTAFTDLMPWELAHLYVESWVISMEVAEGPLAACVGFFALVNPMSDAFTQSAYVVSLLHHSVIQ